MRRAVFRMAFVAAVGGLVLGACSKTVDTADVEKKIAKQLAEANGGDYKVDCPDDVKFEVGKTFECKVSGDSDGTLTVELKKGDRWEVVDVKEKGSPATGDDSSTGDTGDTTDPTEDSGDMTDPGTEDTGETTDSGTGDVPEEFPTEEPTG